MTKMTTKKSSISKLMEEEKWAEARTLLESELKKDPNNHWLWVNLASVKHEQRKYKEAFKDITKALQIMPECPLAMWQEACILHMLGVDQYAKETLVKLIINGAHQLASPIACYECWEDPKWTKDLLLDCMNLLYKINQSENEEGKK